MYLLDTDHLAVLLRRNGPEFRQLKRRIAQVLLRDIWYPIVSIDEQWVAAHDLIRRARDGGALVTGYEFLHRILASFPPAQLAPFDRYSAAKYEAMRSAHLNVPDVPLRIAAIAVANSLTLLTGDPAMYAGIPKFATDNWLV